mmetsp:Transcript_14328/g.22314  ORF Transcript_14328/g.22314 Transcript_14328/m.22314 type:complete len:193 (-) Transcript_14328:866-1444(-)|eukprot:CAMPEP_0201540634 /NCGR_PEP_ID=MMETSP0161_2-20130828/71046_1 /ASSEMBLY_ACC=CAM_ASM_000251 /TAXON_ID=180227 /ORGANISM="Neoparamoeba aestuarina, Strain SoJaBio B1-5/56/2" /LENGTH=192 /DNA_ID=CAMNT_0047948115 /DNA_START=93 /DNA_END=671 /DNA_ORIENTATION=+
MGVTESKPVEELKVLLVGGDDVGKSGIFFRFDMDMYIFDHVDYYDPIKGCDSTKKLVQVAGNNYSLEIFDQARDINEQHFKEELIRLCHIIVLVFDLTSQQSFDDLAAILQNVKEIRRTTDNIYTFALVGAKLDLENQRQVSKEQAVEFAKQEGMKYVEVSAKTGEGLNDLLTHSVRSYQDHPGFQPNIKRA